jgi:hypothetical protein
MQFIGLYGGKRQHTATKYHAVHSTNYEWVNFTSNYAIRKVEDNINTVKDNINFSTGQLRNWPRS